jgi:hypothetical protein
MRNVGYGRAFSFGVVLLAAGALAGAPGPAKPALKRVAIGKNVVLEVEGAKRRVVVKAAVCLREGALEGLLTRKGTKEHEYILSADVDARQVHAALVAAGAKPGAPVQFDPRYKPARGAVIKVSLRYRKGGKTVTVPAREWVRDAKRKKDLDLDWVFGGSRLVPNPEGKDKPPVYLANGGDLICLCNMETAMLDVPVKSPKALDARVYEAHSDRIPAQGTAVEVIFEPVPAKKK